MAIDRSTELCIARKTLPLPCFFPSVSSVKTNLMPVDYIELLDAASHPLYLVSAYDIVNSSSEHQQRMDSALNRSKERGSVILMDSGNYEGFWKDDAGWLPNKFHRIVSASQHHLCFCHDNHEPPGNSESIAADVIASVLRDQKHALGTVAPIVHGAVELLPGAARIVAEQLYPVVLAVPERALGEGIVERIRTVRRIREALSMLEVYCPLHLLGTGNPLSIIAYAMAGADCFDGLEWCQTVVDHQSGRLFHFQQWDLFRHQTEWGENNALPYIQSVLMHNLAFYQVFMEALQKSLISGVAEDYLGQFASEKQTMLLLKAIKGGG